MFTLGLRFLLLLHLLLLLTQNVFLDDLFKRADSVIYCFDTLCQRHHCGQRTVAKVPVSKQTILPLVEVAVYKQTILALVEVTVYKQTILLLVEYVSNMLLFNLKIDIEKF